MTEQLHALQQRCNDMMPCMIELLEEVVRINSYTWNKKGADAVSSIFSRELQALGFSVEHIPHSEVGDTLVALSPAALTAPAQKRILLCGHLDTVFPPEMGFDCFEEWDGQLRGPGVIDMKGGLVAAIYALEAIQHLNSLESLPISFVINTDEEVGSPFSTAIIQREAAKSALAFVFECCGLEGQVVTARKGKHGFRIQCTGKAGHVGQAGLAKPSAILELAHKIIAVEALNAPDRGLTCNVGCITGGTTPNTIPENAVAEVDCRFVTESDARFVDASIDHIVSQVTTPGVACSLETTGKRPPMEASEGGLRLFSALQHIGDTLGVPVKQERRGGVSDANTIAAMGIPVLDGLGPSGDQDHSTREYMVISSLPQRTTLAAAGILHLGARFSV